MYECDYCINGLIHGGKCAGRWTNNLCISYEKDTRGKWIVEDRWLNVPIGIEIPKVNENCELVFNDGELDKMVKFYDIKEIIWNMKGEIGIHVKYKMGYWSEENGVITDKPKLRLVR
jgi:hypothetical protein